MADPVTPAPAAATPAPAASPTTPEGTKVIAGPEFSRRVVHAQKTIEAERKKLATERAEIEAWKPKIKGYEEASALAKTNRKEFLAKMGITAVEAAQLFDLAPKTGAATKTAEAAADKPVEDMTAKELAQLKSDLAEIRKEREAEKLEAQKQSEAQKSVAFEAEKTRYLTACAEAAKGDDFAYTVEALKHDADDTRELMWEVADALCKADPTMKGVPDPVAIAKAVETYYEEEAGRLAKIVKKAKAATPSAPAAGTPAAAPTAPAEKKVEPRLNHAQVMAKIHADVKAKRAARAAEKGT